MTDSVDLALITESWICPDYDTHSLSWPNYTFISQPRIHKKGGGLAIWCRIAYKITDITHKFNFTWAERKIEILCTHIDAKNFTSILILVYFPPNTRFDSLMETYFSNFLKDAVAETDCENIIIAGDFNQADFSLVSGEYNLENLIDQPTRNEAYLDRIYVSSVFKTAYDNILLADPIGNSDHKTIILSSISNTRIETTHRSIQVYDFRDSNIFTAFSFISSIKWENYKSQSANVLVESIYCIFDEALKLVPSKSIKPSVRDKPWMNNVIKCLINERWKAYHNSDFPKYNHYKNKVKQAIIKAKSNWVNKIKQKKNIWGVVKEIDGKRALQQKYNIDAIPNITNNLITLYSHKGSVYEQSNHTFEIDSHALYANIETSLHSIKTKTATGLDNIPVIFYKVFKQSIIKPIFLITSQIMQTCVFPEKLKESFIIPIPKSKSSDTNNFRPIAITNKFARIIEKTIYLHFEDELNKHFGDNQFGFRKNSSTTLAFIYMYESILQMCDRNLGCIVFAIDFSKAFDMVHHDTLITKMSFSSHFQSIMRSYLKGRTTHVKINNSYGETIQLLNGIPQGSVLGPTLFNIYIQDLTAINSETKIIKYADDVTFLIPYNGESSTRIVTEEIENVKNWAIKNEMKINQKKSKILPILKRSTNFSINTEFTVVDNLKILGFTLQKNLSLNKHMKDACSRACRNIFILKKLRPICSTADLNTIFQLKIASIIEYGMPTLVNISKKSKNRIYSIYKRCHKLICPHNPCNCQIRNFSNHQQQQIFKSFMKFQHYSIFKSLMPSKSHTGRFILPRISTNRQLNSFIFYGSKLFNDNFKR